ncbi:MULTISPECIES: sulfurtransferase [unclassified Pseudoalteromonas]|jgi:thiosulfate/3-mercaptopyruvate sulfurtransferase|uniref:sulfurtransferase n=1 Tax=Pseudoalteromonas sp. APM04 TaxID=2699396 RepID=UPI0002318973|nr:MULTISPECIES: sulfurtransferase [unclassified Pseudoalteromonas]UOB74009.1 sulfurtransferase [Pseudoalteromonas sp. APM04]GAA75699.1 thiosulfate/3-mercaptopyruvate sulfurtransferase [Pseudoalteromonas sp. BSi20480]
MKYLVDAKWLKIRLEQTNLVIFDAGMLRPGVLRTYMPEAMLPNAKRFDIKNELADKSNPLSSTMCNAQQFTQVMQHAGVNHDSFIVVYEDAGLFSAARAWWMLKAMGHHNVKVLNGGLKKWLACRYAVQQGYSEALTCGNFEASYNPNYFIDRQQVLAAIDDVNTILLDARAYKRFTGEESEPRKGMRGGHIPQSRSLPFLDLLTDGEAKAFEEIKIKFENAVGTAEYIQFSCGSGITACILALFADECGYKNLSVYDASWSEWGASNSLPIVTGEK